MIWPRVDPGLFVRAGINEQIWTKFARTEKILILHSSVAQLVTPVQKTQAGRKYLQQKKNFYQFSISRIVFETIFKTA